MAVMIAVGLDGGWSRSLVVTRATGGAGATPGATAVAPKAQDNSHRAPMCRTPCARSVVVNTGDDDVSRQRGRDHHGSASTAGRPAPFARGLTITLLMLLATLAAIGVIAFAAVHSGQGSGALGEAQHSTIGQLAATG